MRVSEFEGRLTDSWGRIRPLSGRKFLARKIPCGNWYQGFQQRVLDLLGQSLEILPPTSFLQVDSRCIWVDSLQRATNAMPGAIEARVISITGHVSVLVDVVDMKFVARKDEVNFVKWAVSKLEDRVPHSKVKAVRVPEGEKVSITNMYLTVDAKLWRRTRLCDDASANHDNIKTWEGLQNGAQTNFIVKCQGSTRVNPLQLLSALQEKAAPKQKGLMYVRVQVNGKEVMAMVDSGATHNFVADYEIQMLGLSLTQYSSRLKAVNLEAKPI
ncbi:hypothetical protein Salat_1896900 [Sesamum alatum]|uniref:Uncharacterized protein n=1 Tax=Sesamum alatum TaxID=300844 RepID=A0AAE1Y443_9LAMI|nr:hypothetical protein Salat_1896900 [Sesamum alatum]